MNMNKRGYTSLSVYPFFTVAFYNNKNRVSLIIIIIISNIISC
jgi:hypothetical protein